MTLAPWTEEEVRSLASIGTGAKDTKDRIAGGKYPFFVRSQKVERIDSWSFDGEAVLTAGDGVGTGKVFHYIDGKFDYHQRVYRISNFRSDISGRYFFHQFSRNFLARIESLTAKSSVDSVRMETIAGMQIPVPERAEQDCIVRAIDDADDLIATLERLIIKKQAIKQGMMQQLLTGRTRLPGFTDEWTDRRLGDVLTVRHGRNQRSVESPSGTVPILATGGQIGWADRPLYSKPSVLIGRKGTIDRPQYQSRPFWTVDTLFYTEISAKADPRFLYYVFQTIDWRSMNEASSVPSLSSTRIESVDVQLPDLTEQMAIREVLDAADAEITVLDTRLAKAHAIKTGMMQQLLTGRTRLPVEVNS
ncbi:restriction endonuclease subunit S [Prescottella equi]|uniref:restriction endonuclease subunit S n=1 Tax=Rhodococcus hoagii TaxID=43767 RepID=UPI003D96D805